MRSLILLFIFISCSVGSLLIGQLDSYVTIKTAERYHFYTKQEDRFEEDLGNLFNEVKPQMMAINAQLKYIRNKKEKRVTQEELNAVRNAFKPMFKKMTLVIAKYVAENTEKQMKLYLDDLEKRNNKAEKKLKKERYQKRIPKKFAEFFGELTSEQKKYLSENIAPFLAWNTHRSKINNEMFLGLLNAPYDKTRKVTVQQVFDKVVAGFFVNLDQGNLDAIVQIINNFLKTLTKEQKNQINDKLDLAIGIIDSFIENKY